ncbi:MAG: hypothetical protein NC405_00185 [Odoribacter sp.]|nr:hypothetical protein [Odoribacter sp.]
MKRLFRTVTILIMCGALALPAADAQTRGRNNNGGGTHRPSTAPSQPSRPAQPSRPGNQGQGLGNRPQQPPTSSRPNQPQHPGNRPQQPGNRPQRPGNGSQRPVNPGYRPGGPAQGHRPPGGHPGYGPMRPNTPPPRPFYRPTPPPHWRPAPGWRPINSILGITLGTAFNISLNALINSGYSINSYGSNTICLNDVSMLNMNWPSATLYFNNAGQLYASQFVYSSTIYDTSRYDISYTMLTNNYGAPVSVNNSGNSIETTWWGPGNQFIRLTYESEYTASGYPAYFTILSFGN